MTTYEIKFRGFRMCNDNKKALACYAVISPEGKDDLFFNKKFRSIPHRVGDVLEIEEKEAGKFLVKTDKVLRHIPSEEDELRSHTEMATLNTLKMAKKLAAKSDLDVVMGRFHTIYWRLPSNQRQAMLLWVVNKIQKG